MTSRGNLCGTAAAQAANLPSASAATALSAVFDTLDAFLARIGARARKHDRQRQAARQLAGMSDYALRDIGLHRSEILSVTHNLRRFERRRHARI
jgi:uncharacterized protein YjiS (DUF1127 family)